ncbi:hypothetical protein ACFXG4_41405 [Nocardia sp. NPDC059246]|uniref:hypothetical protein n=1 Tax=unclassified Nocardia TaxID=2637762 RepID=UPI0036C86539
MIDPHVRDEVRRVFGGSANFARLTEAEQDAAIDSKARTLTGLIQNRLRDGRLVAPWLSPHGTGPDATELARLIEKETTSVTREVLEAELYAHWPEVPDNPALAEHDRPDRGSSAL